MRNAYGVLLSIGLGAFTYACSEAEDPINQQPEPQGVGQTAAALEGSSGATMLVLGSQYIQVLVARAKLACQLYTHTSTFTQVSPTNSDAAASAAASDRFSSIVLSGGCKNQSTSCQEKDSEAHAMRTLIDFMSLNQALNDVPDDTAPYDPAAAVDEAALQSYIKYLKDHPEEIESLGCVISDRGTSIITESASSNTQQNYCRSERLMTEDVPPLPAIPRDRPLHVVSSHFHALSVAACFGNQIPQTYYHYTCAVTSNNSIDELNGAVYGGVSPALSAVPRQKSPSQPKTCDPQDYNRLAAQCGQATFCDGILGS